MFSYRNDNLIIRPMIQRDINIILNNFAGQGWSKPSVVLERYLSGQNSNELYVFIADYNNDVAGYTILHPQAKNGPFANQGIPEISDFTVFTKYQRQGIGNTILDAAEKKAAALTNKVCLGVGLHDGYGAAQRIYIKRGYIPDGTGVWYNNAKLEQYADCKNDDDLLLFLCKELRCS